MSPLVSILFPCYNAEKFLKYSLDSILNQDYKHLEIICINDGSSDGTLDLLKAAQSRDKRIVIVNNEKNLGLIDSLNKSFAFITGEYFARMDADDFSPPDRISQQVEFLSKHPQYDLVSSGYNYFRRNGAKLEYVPSVGSLPNSLKFISLFSTPLAHGAVLGKSSIIKKGQYFYDKHFPHAEDFELFSRLVWQNVPITNMNVSLYWARLNEGSVSAVYNTTQVRTNQEIIKRNLQNYLGIEDDLDEKTLKIISSRIDIQISLGELKTTYALLDKLYNVAENKLKFSPGERREIQRYLNLQRLNILIQSNKMMFRSSKSAALRFLFSSLFLLRLGQLNLLFRKLSKLAFSQK